MTPADLAQALELMAQALRLMPPSGAASASPVAQAMPARTLGAWLDIHEAQVLAKGYKIQTIRNRTANLKHVRRLWGDRQIDGLRAHEIIARIRSEFLPGMTPTAQRVLAELRDAYNAEVTG